MKFLELNLQHYMVFSQFSCSFSPGLNVFIGPNGTGKSQLFKLLYTAGTSHAHPESFADALAKNLYLDSYSCPFSELISQKPPADTAKATLTALDETTQEEAMLSFSLRKGEDTLTLRGREAWHRLFSDAALFFLPFFGDNAKKPRTKPKAVFLAELQHMLGGSIHYDAKRKQPVLSTAHGEISAALFSMGQNRLATLYGLLLQGYLGRGDVLLLQNPEQFLHPKTLAGLTRLLLLLELSGVQIFIETQSYFLCKYFDLYAESANHLAFYSLYWHKGKLQYETARRFDLLVHNDLIDAFFNLYRAEVQTAMQENDSDT